MRVFIFTINKMSKLKRVLAAQPFAGADSRFSRVCLELRYDRGGKRAAQLKAVGQQRLAPVLSELLVNPS